MTGWLETYTALEGIRLNMVATGKGNFVDQKGSSRGISNNLDRQLIGHLRKLADVIVTGGATARSEGYRVPSNAALAVISTSFVLEDANFLSLPDPNGALDVLRDLGFKNILLETGPTLSKHFLQADQVDEFCLTVTEGNLESAELTVRSLGSKLILTNSKDVEGTLFTIWRRGIE